MNVEIGGSGLLKMMIAINVRGYYSGERVATLCLSMTSKTCKASNVDHGDTV